MTTFSYGNLVSVVILGLMVAPACLLLMQAARLFSNRRLVNRLVVEINDDVGAGSGEELSSYLDRYIYRDSVALHDDP
jgi:hypothetical protein